MLTWIDKGSHFEAQLGDPTDGAFFTLTHHPSCYRRGPWRLLIEICGGEHHHDWGCFDEQDQPMRWYHSKTNALDEAESIAKVLLKDRHKHKRPPILNKNIDFSVCGYCGGKGYIEKVPSDISEIPLPTPCPKCGGEGILKHTNRE